MAPFALLKLPIELKLNIFSYLMPWKDRIWVDNRPRKDGKLHGPLFAAITRPIMQVSRQLRTETLSAFYQTNSFHISSMKDLAWFMANGNPYRCENIGRMTLAFDVYSDWFHDSYTQSVLGPSNVLPFLAIETIRHCTSLHNLTVIVDAFIPNPDNEWTENLLKPKAETIIESHGFAGLCYAVQLLPALEQVWINADSPVEAQDWLAKSLTPTPVIKNVGHEDHGGEFLRIAKGIEGSPS